MKHPVIIVAILAGVTAVLALAFVDVIPPRSLTATRMQVFKVRVLRFARNRGALPKSLSELPVEKGRDSSIRDGWKRNIFFQVSTSGLVTFRSLGRDGLVGGQGEDSDIMRSFATRDPQGKWSDERIGWSEDTFRIR